MMALLAWPPAVPRPLPAPPQALPTPAPQSPAQLAATPFAQALAGAIGQRSVSGPEVLRAARRSLLATQPTQPPPWLGGKADECEALAEATLAAALVPRSPDDLLREGVRRAAGGAGAAVGVEQSVAEVPAASAATPSTTPQPVALATAGIGDLGVDGRARPTSHRSGAPADAASSPGSVAGLASGAAATAATAATAAVGLKAEEATAATAAVQMAARGTNLLLAAAGQAAEVLDNGQLLANGQQPGLDDQWRVLRQRSDDGGVPLRRERIELLHVQSARSGS